MTIHDLQLRAPMGFRPRSPDEAARTVELVASTGAPVERADMEGVFTEVLTIAQDAVDLSRFEGMPLLDSHRQDGLDRVLGVVRSASIASGQLIVTVEISHRADAIWRDIVAGIIRNVSVGYGVQNFEDRVDRATGRRVRTITRWMLHEISLVPVGADAGAKTRGKTMPIENTPAPAPAPAAVPTVTPVPTPLETRAETNREIRALATTFELGTEFADELIDRAASVEEARAAALTRLQAAPGRQTPGPRVTVIATHDAPDQIALRMGEALYLRANPRHQVSDPARPYVGYTTLDMAREMLRLRGVSTTGLSMADTITRALHTTSDFPQIFADTANRTLRASYQSAPAALKQAARQTTARDFRAKTTVQLGEAPMLEKVNEHGEYKYGTMAEAKESYRIDTFGKIVGLSRKAIINDDLGAFTDLAGKMGMAAADFEAQFLVDLLEVGAGDGPTMDDGVRLFNAAHGNTASSAVTGDTVSDQLEVFAAAVAAGRLAMRKQVGLSERRINAAPKFVIVPPELETLGELLVTSVTPAKAADANPLGSSLTLLTEARLSSSVRWYLAGDTAQIDGLEYAYLQGAEGPQTETRAGFEVDGVEVKVRLDFGAAFLDWRSWYRNEGEEVTA